MSIAVLNGEIINGSTNNAAAINYHKINTITSVQSELDSVNKILGGVTFGIDGDGNRGYHKADGSFVPFKSGWDVEHPIYQHNAGTSFSYSTCEIGKDYTVMYAPWSSAGTSKATEYLNISSYSGCEAPIELYRIIDTHHTVFAMYKIKAIATTITVQWNSSGGGCMLVFE